ncbi:MAG: Crp/Fnr family transcriptional regulator [Maribacter sp.]|nr:Crp/Fnr family transcriptional regulator [Maribacter sp.]
MLISEPTLREKLEENYSHLFESKFLDEIIKVGFRSSIKRGGLLIDIGEEMTHIPLILSGVIKIIRKENKKELVLYFLEHGDTCAISFANCINRQQSIFKGIVEEDVDMVLLPVDKIDKWLVKYESFRHFIIDSYHFRLLEMVESIDDLAFLKMKERLLKYLKNIANTSNDLNLEITHQEVATDLNTSRVVITRLLKELHDEGKIYSKRNKIEILEN